MEFSQDLKVRSSHCLTVWTENKYNSSLGNIQSDKSASIGISNFTFHIFNPRELTRISQHTCLNGDIPHSYQHIGPVSRIFTPLPSHRNFQWVGPSPSLGKCIGPMGGILIPRVIYRSNHCQRVGSLPGQHAGPREGTPPPNYAYIQVQWVESPSLSSFKTYCTCTVVATWWIHTKNHYVITYNKPLLHT